MKNLKKIREDNKISQQKLASHIGVSRSTIAMWETDGSQPDNDSLRKIANYFNVSTDYLLDMTNIPQSTIPSSSPIRISKKEQEILSIFEKLNEEKKNKVIGYASAQLNDDNTYFVGRSAAFGGGASASIQTPDSKRQFLSIIQEEKDKKKKEK